MKLIEEQLLQPFTKGGQRLEKWNLAIAQVLATVYGVRTYDNRDKRMGDFGYGWRLDIDNVRVEESGVTGLQWVGTRTAGD